MSDFQEGKGLPYYTNENNKIIAIGCIECLGTGIKPLEKGKIPERCPHCEGEGKIKMNGKGEIKK